MRLSPEAIAAVRSAAQALAGADMYWKRWKTNRSWRSAWRFFSAAYLVSLEFRHSQIGMTFEKAQGRRSHPARHSIRSRDWIASPRCGSQ